MTRVSVERKAVDHLPSGEAPASLARPYDAAPGASGDELHRRLLDGVPDAVALQRGDRIVFANAACARLLGAEDASVLVGLSALDWVEPDRLPAFRQSLETAPADGQPPEFVEERFRRLDGSLVEVAVAVVAVGGEGERLVQLVARDVGGRKREEERIAALAYRDSLTALPNRRLFYDRLSIAVAQAHRYRHRLAVLFVDLDRFKAVNDTLGHAAGDRVLKAVAERLSSCVREGDTVARLAGDEFTLLLPGIHYPEDVTKVAQKIQEAMRQPFFLEEREVRVTASGGISLYPEDGQDAETLVKNADTAMYRAKERGRDNYQVYSAAMTAKTLEKAGLESDLRGALERGELALYYQPCLDLPTGRIVAVEALLRWQHPDIGLVFPKDFMSLADFTGLILAMGPWVLENACQQAQAWQKRGSRELRVAVNLSAYELQQRDLVRHLEGALERSGLEPRFLQIEVPEGYAMQDVDRTIQTLRAVRAVGVSISIDGFGVGFSSLAHLRRLPIDTLKLDLSFVRDTTTDPDDASLVTAVIAVAHSLKLKVIAQGVETDAQVALLRSLQCDEVQGYLWSPPVPPAECERLLSGVGVSASSILRRPRGRKGKGRRARGL